MYKRQVEAGVLTKGIMYSCVKNGIDYVLAGSIRDDGPMPGVITDSAEAQDAMRRCLKDVELALMLSTMLHSIATGNLLPGKVKTVCVDINPATVTKLVDRGSHQADVYKRQACACAGGRGAGCAQKFSRMGLTDKRDTKAEIARKNTEAAWKNHETETERADM